MCAKSLKQAPARRDHLGVFREVPMSARLSLPAATAVLSLLAAGAAAESWRVPGQFPTIQAAIDSPLVKDGDTIRVRSGRHAGATVTKAVAIRAQGRAVIRTGPSVGPLGEAGFLFPGGGQGSGASVVGFVFDGVAFPVFSRGADDVTVERNTLLGPVQGVSNWGGGSWGNGWDVTHNRIRGLRTACGGGIGIFFGDYQGGTVVANLVAHNEIGGRVLVPADDCGGYGASGVSIFADFRWGAAGAAAVEHNRVSKNRVRLESSRPELVPVSGVELAELDPVGPDRVIRDNAVVFNDLRGMEVPIEAHPEELLDLNRIEKNLTGAAPGPRGPLTQSLLAPGAGRAAPGGPVIAPVR
jgi:hypothetical protein